MDSENWEVKTGRKLVGEGARGWSEVALERFTVSLYTDAAMQPESQSSQVSQSLSKSLRTRSSHGFIGAH